MNTELLCVNLLDEILQNLEKKYSGVEEKIRNRLLNHMLLQLVSFHKLEGRLNNEQLLSRISNPILDHNFVSSLTLSRDKTLFRFEEQFFEESQMYDSIQRSSNPGLKINS